MNQVAKTKDFRKVMVANRGEIAIRIFRACYDLGLNTVAVYSKEDEYNIFRVKADESYMIGENKSPLGCMPDVHPHSLYPVICYFSWLRHKYPSIISSSSRYIQFGIPWFLTASTHWPSPIHMTLSTSSF